jgi:hypothetical protein
MKRHDNSVSILVIIEQDLTVYHPKHLELFYFSYRNVPNKYVSEYLYSNRFSFIVIIIIIFIIAIGLSPGGSGYFTCMQNTKLVTTEFKSGGLHKKHVVATWNLGNHLSICLCRDGRLQDFPNTDF